MSSVSLTGMIAGQTVGDQTTIAPFALVALSDSTAGQTEVLTVTLSATANGTLTNLGGGTYDASTGIYTVIGTAAAVTSALDALIFNPTPNQVAPGQVVTTTFTIADIDTAAASTTDSTTTVYAGTIQPPNTGISLGGNGQNASDADDIRVTLATGSVVYEITNSRVDVAGNGVTVNVASTAALGMVGSAETVNITGSGSAVWIGGNGSAPKFANIDQVILSQAAGVTVIDSTRLNVTGNGGWINVGNNDALGITGSAETVNVLGTGSSIWIGGNGVYASDANDDILLPSYAAVVYETDSSRLDVIGNNATVNVIGRTDALGITGSGDTVIVTASPSYQSAVWIGGNGANASDANDDVVSQAYAGVTESDNSRVDVLGDGGWITVGNDDILGVSGRAETVNITGTGSAVWIGGNGVTTVIADNVNLFNAASVTVSDLSNVNVYGNAGYITVGNSDAVGVTGSAETVNVLGAHSLVWIGGNGAGASGANDDVVNLSQGGAVYASVNSHVDVFGNNVTAGNVAGAVGVAMGVTGSNDTVTISATTTVWIGGNGQNATDANDDKVNAFTGGSITELSNSRVDVSGSEGAMINEGTIARLGVITGGGPPMGFITGTLDALTVTAVNWYAQSVTGFNEANGDQLDLSKFLAGEPLAHDLSNLSSYIGVQSSGSNTTLTVTGLSGTDSIQLSGSGALTLQDLLNATALVLPAH